MLTKYWDEYTSVRAYVGDIPASHKGGREFFRIWSLVEDTVA